LARKVSHSQGKPIPMTSPRFAPLRELDTLFRRIPGARTETRSVPEVLDREVARKVASMMAGACEFGSASRSFHHHKVAVAGKTGTLTQESPTYTQYSWFVGYTPIDKPTLVIAVVLGNPENWQMKGHEVARKLIDHTTHKPS